MLIAVSYAVAWLSGIVAAAMIVLSIAMFFYGRFVLRETVLLELSANLISVTIGLIFLSNAFGGEQFSEVIANALRVALFAANGVAGYRVYRKTVEYSIVQSQVDCAQQMSEYLRNGDPSVAQLQGLACVLGEAVERKKAEVFGNECERRY